MKILVRITKDGKACEVYYNTLEARFAVYSIDKNGVVFGHGVPHWLDLRSFGAFVKDLHDRWLASYVLDEYDGTLHEYSLPWDYVRGHQHVPEIDSSKMRVGNASSTKTTYS